ncbi:MAG: hypothetical protein ABSF71_32095 [Terriglobia bacterium]
MRRETVGNGGLESTGNVVVHAMQPLETTDKFALKVHENLHSGIQYTYAFPTDKNSDIGVIAHMFQALATAGFGTDLPGERKRMMEGVGEYAVKAEECRDKGQG